MWTNEGTEGSSKNKKWELAAGSNSARRRPEQ
jgi:hypothetical protein